MKKTFYLSLALFFCACNFAPDIQYKMLDIESAKTQMKIANYQNNYIFKNRREVFLDESEKNLLVRILNSSVNTYNKKNSEFERIDIESYNFFFIPTLDEKNKKIIYIFGICNENNGLNEELHQFFLVEDDVNCYIQTVINLTDKYEGWFLFNTNSGN